MAMVGEGGGRTHQGDCLSARNAFVFLLLVCSVTLRFGTACGNDVGSTLSRADRLAAAGRYDVSSSTISSSTPPEERYRVPLIDVDMDLLEDIVTEEIRWAGYSNGELLARQCSSLKGVACLDDVAAHAKLVAQKRSMGGLNIMEVGYDSVHTKASTNTSTKPSMNGPHRPRHKASENFWKGVGRGIYSGEGCEWLSKKIEEDVSADEAARVSVVAFVDGRLPNADLVAAFNVAARQPELRRKASFSFIDCSDRSVRMVCYEHAVSTRPDVRVFGIVKGDVDYRAFRIEPDPLNQEDVIDDEGPGLLAVTWSGRSLVKSIVHLMELMESGGKGDAEGDAEEETLLKPRSRRRSRTSSRRIHAVFLNLRAYAVDIYWVSFEGREELYFTIESGATRAADTFQTHVWIGRDSATQEYLQTAVMETSEQIMVIGPRLFARNEEEEEEEEDQEREEREEGEDYSQ